MDGSFASHTYNIGALLGRHSFPNYNAKRVIVPKFQRSFSWEPTHVSTFWDDVLGFHARRQQKGANDTYFVGPIVIQPNEEYISLLDGQQRLATTSILLGVIRDLARTKGGQLGSDLARDIQRDLIMVDDEAGVFALTLSELDEPFFRTNVQEDPPTCSVKPRLRSHRLIQQAKKFLSDKVDGLLVGQGPKELVATLKALKSTVASHLKLVAIEVKSDEEAFLIFETLNDRGLRLAVPDLVLNFLMRTANNDDERTSIRKSWNALVENLGQRNISTFIRHMWVSQYGDVKNQGLFREIRLKLGGQHIKSLSFAQQCEEESRLYAALVDLNAEVIPHESVEHLDGLMNHLEAERALPLLLSALASLEPNDFTKLVRATVTVITRYSILSQLDPALLESALYDAARSIRVKKRAGESSGAVLAAAKDILRKINPKQDHLKTSLPDVYLTKSQADYIVYALADRVQSQTKAVKVAAKSLEHIFPENADKSEWLDAATLEPYAWHIGNLVAMEPPLNREAGNKSFSNKLPIYKKSELKVISELVQCYKTWDQATILDRASKLLPLIAQVWPEAI